MWNNFKTIFSLIFERKKKKKKEKKKNTRNLNFPD